MKMLVFDMDGTIADLYNVKNWLEKLRAEDESPYLVAKPMYDMDSLAVILDWLKTLGWKVVVTSWLSMNGSKEYNEKVIKAKKAWLDRYKFPYDEIHIVEYGKPKEFCTMKQGGYQILIDDNEEIRKRWNLGDTFNANENIIPKLVNLITKEVA